MSVNPPFRTSDKVPRSEWHDGEYEAGSGLRRIWRENLWKLS